MAVFYFFAVILCQRSNGQMMIVKDKAMKSMMMNECGRRVKLWLKDAAVSLRSERALRHNLPYNDLLDSSCLRKLKWSMTTVVMRMSVRTMLE